MSAKFTGTFWRCSRSAAAAGALALAAVLAISPAHALAGEGEAGTFDPMSDGSDGALVVNENTVINLALAPTGSWMDPAPEPGLGVYDPTIWAVVFKYESVAINAGTVTFQNHPSGAPVVWLVEGDVVVANGATVNLNGAPGVNNSLTFPAPGPGGFAGGTLGTVGFGPGGGSGGVTGQGGHYGSGARAYGSANIVPLIGGSGGGQGTQSAGFRPGAGGGAVLIAAAEIAVQGVISANGGDYSNSSSGAGSGGAVRLVGNDVTVIGTNRITATTNTSGVGGGSHGRIRIEALASNIGADAVSPSTFPHYTTARPGPLFQDETTPSLRVASLNGTPVSEDPLAGVQSIDVGIHDTNTTITIEIHAFNIEPGSIIEVKAQQAQGSFFTVVQSTPLAGSIVFSTATAEIPLNSGIPADIVLRVLP